MFSMLLVSFIFFLFLFYPKKILILLCLEGCFVSCFFYFLSSSILFNSCSIFFCFLMLVFLVLDSVMGVSLLLSIGRSFGPHSSWLF